MNEFLLLLAFLLFSASSSATDTAIDELLTEINATSRQYNCGSSGTVVVNKGFQGRFASPNYPNSYGAQQDCMWSLSTSADAKFSLICDPINISCKGDYLIYSPSGDPYFKDAPPPVCGSSRLQGASTGSNLVLAFHSSPYSSGGGFSCIAQAVPRNPAPVPVISTTPAAPTCDCGIKGQDRIVGGATAGVTEWPWQTLLADISQSGGGNQYCGATLIAASWVLTAAHCTFGRQAANIGVVVGQYNSISLTSSAQVRKVTQFFQHPKFDKTVVDNDIALLQLSSPVTFTAAVRPVCLPNRFVNYEFNKQIGYITGWGTTTYGGVASSNLLEVAVPILSTSACRLYSSVSAKITNNMFCTYADGKDACQGDSGGPLNWIDPDTGRAFLIGITSWGIGCAKPDTPGVYTKVTNYLPWIQQYTGSLCSA